MTTLEQDFAKARSRVESNLRFEAERWATWLCMAREDVLDIPDALSEKEPYDDHWNAEQKKFFFVLCNLRDVTWTELKNLILDMGDVDVIWDACMHVAYMYGFTVIDEEHIDDIIEEVTKCPKCQEAMSVFAYQYVACGRPLTLRQVMQIGHYTDALWSLVTLVENEVMCERSYEWRMEEQSEVKCVGR